MAIRLYALLDDPGASAASIHFRGLPPELTEGIDTRERLPFPHVLIIDEKTDGIYLYRFTQNGDFGGDTLHASIADAMEQARYEYATLPNDWHTLPENITDVIPFVLQQVARGGK